MPPGRTFFPDDAHVHLIDLAPRLLISLPGAAMPLQVTGKDEIGILLKDESNGKIPLFLFTVHCPPFTACQSPVCRVGQFSDMNP
jgi:hypothetical protein